MCFEFVMLFGLLVVVLLVLCVNLFLCCVFGLVLFGFCGFCDFGLFDLVWLFG